MATRRKNLGVYPNVPKVENVRQCPICNEEAPKGEAHSPHYGGICCYSCRAFFRRAHQKTKTPRMRCKYEGKCTIPPKGQLRCKKCRYEKCLSNGMSPKYVLTGDEKKIRFRNYFKKKNDLERSRQARSPSPTGEAGSSRRRSRSEQSSRDTPQPSTSQNDDSSSINADEAIPSTSWGLTTSQHKSRGFDLEEDESRSVSPLTPKRQNSPVEPQSPGVSQSPKLSHSPRIKHSPKIKHSLRSQYSPRLSQSPSSVHDTRCESPIARLSPQLSRRVTILGMAPNTLNFSQDEIQKAYVQRRHLVEEPESVSRLPVPLLLPIRQQYRTIQPSINYQNIPREYMTVGQSNRLAYVENPEHYGPLLAPQNGFRYHSINHPQTYANQTVANAYLPIRPAPDSLDHQQYQTDHIHPRYVPYPRRMGPYQQQQIAESSLSSQLLDMYGQPITYGGIQEDVNNVRDDSSLLLHPVQQYNLPVDLRSTAARSPDAGLWVRGHPCIGEDVNQPGVLLLPYNQNQGPDLHRGYQGSLSPLLAMRSQLSSVLDAFTLTCGKLSLNTGIIQDLIQNHQRKKALERSTIITQLSQITSIMTEFASTQLIFSSLCVEDQTVLLKNNIPLYLQYVLAKYFSAETGLEQLTWILEGQVDIESIEEVKRLGRISLQEYNTSLNLFPNSGVVEQYSFYSQNIGLFYPFPQHCNGLVANMLLYYTNETLNESLKEPKRINCIFKEAKDLVRIGFEHLDRALDVNASNNIGPLIQTLIKMKTIFGMWKVKCDDLVLKKPLDSGLSINYTSTEEGWLKQQFHKFQSSYTSVDLPTDYLTDLLGLLSAGKPVGDSFVASWIGATGERLRRVLKSHPEFHSLNTIDQETIWSKNCKSAIAIICTRVNSIKTGKGQLKTILGHFNPADISWEGTFEKLVKLDELKGYYLDEPQVNQGKFDEENILAYTESVKEISEMVSNHQLFQLFILLTLLDTDGLPETSHFSSVSRMRQIYLKLFQRKLIAAGCTFVDYARFRRTLNKVKIFAELLEKF